MRIAKPFGVASAFVAAIVFVAPAEAATVIKIATQAPATSAWAKSLKTWASTVSEKSGGTVELQIVWAGQTGDEAAMVAAMNAGTIHGAVLTGVGLGKIHKPIALLQMPGVFSSLAKFDSTRDALATENDLGLTNAGFVNLGWFDGGVRRPFAKDFALHVPHDFVGSLPRAYEPAIDDVTTTFFHSITGVQAGPTTYSTVLPALASNGHPLGLLATSLESEASYWSQHYNHATDLVAAYEIGAIVLSSKHFPVFPPTAKTVVTDAGRTAAADLAKRSRADDEAAWQRIRTKVTVTTPTAADLVQWQAVWKDTRAHLVGAGYSSASITKIETLGK
jgi:TRAP-type C4-dicarboxylate transport system substrate-binding protein